MTQAKATFEGLKKGAYRKQTHTPKGKKIPLVKIKKDEHSSNPLTRKRAQLAENFRHMQHAGVEVAGKPLANVYVGENLIGNVNLLRGKFIFQPSWDAGPNIPARFSAPTAEEMKIQLAERGLRVETASIETAANTPIKQHLQNKGWEQKGKVWKHPTSGHQIIHTPSTSHVHEYTVTHKSGEVSRHKTNSNTVLRNHISQLSKKPDNSGIANTLKSNSGSLHEYFGKAKGEKLSLSELDRLAHSKHPLADRARLVYNLKKARLRGPVQFKAEE